MPQPPIVEVYLLERTRFIPFVLGIWDYRNAHTRWIVRRAPPGAQIASHTANCDGCIVSGRELKASDIPHIRTPIVTYGPCPHGLPNVSLDEQAIGRVVADHFIDRGFTNFAFIGQRWPEAESRARGFAARLQEYGFSTVLLRPKGREDPPYRVRIEQIAEWLAPLPKPLAVMAPEDNTGRQVIHACERLDISVPDEVSVVGVDNDPLVCEVCAPTLSSASPDMRAFGREVARLLHLRMQGKPAMSVTLSTCAVHERESSDTLAAHDEVVIGTMGYIRQHCTERIDVRDIVRQSGLSRRMLEYRFRRELHRSPRQLLLDRQLRRAAELLITTNHTLDTIATQSGFLDAAALCRMFRKKRGLTPGEYRRKKTGA